MDKGLQRGHHGRPRAHPQCHEKEQAMPGPLAVGATAPDFSLPSHLGDTVTLSSYPGDSGKNVVVFFYPFDWTPV